MKLYVAGPMRGLPEFNFPAFDEVAATLRDMGHEVANPAEHDREVLGRENLENAPGYLEGDLGTWSADTGFDFHAAMQWDLQQVLDGDGIVLLPGWENSTGAKYERTVAEAAGKIIYLAEKRGTPHLTGVYAWHFTPDDVQKRLAVVHEEALTPNVPTGEVRVVDPNTGGAKGSKLQRFDLLPWDSVMLVSEHFGRGAAKYEERNWERGYKWSLSFAALHRHLTWWWHFGQDYDDEGFHHLTAVAWHALVLLAFATRGIGTDDRPYAGVTPSHNEETAA